jgi:hypothetical protein
VCQLLFLLGIPISSVLHILHTTDEAQSLSGCQEQTTADTLVLLLESICLPNYQSCALRASTSKRFTRASAHTCG